MIDSFDDPCFIFWFRWVSPFPSFARQSPKLGLFCFVSRLFIGQQLHWIRLFRRRSLQRPTSDPRSRLPKKVMAGKGRNCRPLEWTVSLDFVDFPTFSFFFAFFFDFPFKMPFSWGINRWQNTSRWLMFTNEIDWLATGCWPISALCVRSHGNRLPSHDPVS